jgi:hypothetical protein
MRREIAGKVRHVQAGRAESTAMDLPEPPRPDLRPPPAPTPQTPVSRPIWKRGWFWIGVVVMATLIGSAIGSGQGEGDADNAPPTAAQPDTGDVEAIPVFDGQSGGQVVALVNNEGIVSAKVLGELPFSCSVTAGNIVKWDKSSETYQDTGQVANDVTGEPADSLMATFFGPIGTGDQQGYVFHSDMNLQPPYPKAIVVTLDCSY